MIPISQRPEPENHQPVENNPSIGFVLSTPDPDRSTLLHQSPNLVHLLVRHRDATLRPVALTASSKLTKFTVSVTVCMSKKREVLKGTNLRRPFT